MTAGYNSTSGQMQADYFSNAAGTGAPNFPFGFTNAGAGSLGYAAGNNSGETISGATLTNFRSYDPSSNITVTLSNNWLAGRQLSISHLGVASTSAVITLAANDGTTIATIFPGSTYTCASNSATPATNSNWLGLTPIQSGWVPFTPVFAAFGTITNSRGFYKREGDSLSLTAECVTGTVTSSTLKLSLPVVPSQLSTDSSKILLNNLGFRGLSIRENPNANTTKWWTANLPTSSTSYVEFASAEYVSAVDPNNPLGGNAFNSSEGFSCFISLIPILGWSSTKG